MSASTKCVENIMRLKLQNRLKPKVLQLLNESYMHNVPNGSETHFKVVIVSDEFEGMPLIKRHRLVNEILADELKSGVHALSIVAKAPEQWKDEPVESSPNCRGGFGK
ncbi:DNA-binding transcriptional regulator BolA [Adelges cooleyi]|uniref:DNA-binding transcriptional regulator BolA n=1 Tax=Adelges cooleyi TaxID=133065 RepID=UPI0021807A73|nr:DNA-binding transcriptional regulator BolA [Adelges cooleyi]